MEELQRVRQTLVVRLKGELDHHNGSKLKQSIQQEWQREVARNILFVMEELEFMDSSGLGLILGRYREAKERGGKTAIVGAVSHARRMLELSGLQDIIPTFATETEALQYLER